MHSILIADDNPENLRVLSSILKHEGYETRVAKNGKQALESIKTAQPDLVLLDIQMPKMDGYEVCRQLKADENLHSIPVIFISAMNEPFNKVMAFKSGGDDYMTKPFQVEEVLARVKIHLQVTIYQRMLEDRNLELLHQFKAMFEQAAVGMIIGDNETQRFLRVNQRYADILGYSPEELVGKTPMDITHPDHIEDDQNRLKQLIETDKTSFSKEKQYIKADGEPVWVRVTVTLVERNQYQLSDYFIAIIEDISEKKQAEEELKQSAEKLKAIFNHRFQLTGLMDETGRLIMANENVCKMAGMENKELYGKYIWQLPLWGQSEELRLEIQKAVHSVQKGNPVNFETTHVDASGDVRYVDFSITPVFGKNGNLVYMVPEGRDITEKRNSEDEQKRLTKQLQLAQKMEAIGTLAGGIAHDFNNILSSILGYSELARMDAPKVGQFTDYLNNIMSAGNRAKDLVQQILTFSRQSEPELKPVSVKIIVKEALKLIRASLPTSIEIKQNLQSAALVMGDPTQIHQIVMNLCTNAGHAMRRGGGILLVELTEVDIDGAVAPEFSAIEPGRYLNLTITDTGEGMPPEILDQIFDPFFTTKKRGEGTGLGLAVVHGILASFGGAIYADSEPGNGASFKIYLPIIEGSCQSMNEIVETLPTGNGRILYVDDEPTIADIGRRILENLNYQVVTCTDSMEALDLFRSQPKRFDLVITDMTMPHMSGEMLAAEMISIRKDIPIILCTGYSHRIAEERSKQIGIRGFLMKPISRAAIAKTVSNVLAAAANKGQ